MNWSAHSFDDREINWTLAWRVLIIGMISLLWIGLYLVNDALEYKYDHAEHQLANLNSWYHKARGYELVIQITPSGEAVLVETKKKGR